MEHSTVMKRDLPRLQYDIDRILGSNINR